MKVGVFHLCLELKSFLILCFIILMLYFLISRCVKGTFHHNTTDFQTHTYGGNLPSSFKRCFTNPCWLIQPVIFDTDGNLSCCSRGELVGVNICNQ